MPVAKSVKDLIDWKEAFLKDKVAAFNAKIRGNNAKIAALRRQRDTQDQITALERNNERQEEGKREVERDLDDFKKGGDGHKYKLADDNISREIDSLMREALQAATAAAQERILDSRNKLVDLRKAARDALINF